MSLPPLSVALKNGWDWIASSAVTTGKAVAAHPEIQRIAMENLAPILGPIVVKQQFLRELYRDNVLSKRDGIRSEKVDVSKELIAKRDLLEKTYFKGVDPETQVRIRSFLNYATSLATKALIEGFENDPAQLDYYKAFVSEEKTYLGHLVELSFLHILVNLFEYDKEKSKESEIPSKDPLARVIIRLTRELSRCDGDLERMKNVLLSRIFPKGKEFPISDMHKKTYAYVAEKLDEYLALMAPPEQRDMKVVAPIQELQKGVALIEACLKRVTLTKKHLEESNENSETLIQEVMKKLVVEIAELDPSFTYAERIEKCLTVVKDQKKRIEALTLIEKELGQDYEKYASLVIIKQSLEMLEPTNETLLPYQETIADYLIGKLSLEEGEMKEGIKAFVKEIMNTKDAVPFCYGVVKKAIEENIIEMVMALGRNTPGENAIERAGKALSGFISPFLKNNHEKIAMYLKEASRTPEETQALFKELITTLGNEMKVANLPPFQGMKGEEVEALLQQVLQPLCLKYFREMREYHEGIGNDETRLTEALMDQHAGNLPHIYYGPVVDQQDKAALIEGRINEERKIANEITKKLKETCSFIVQDMRPTVEGYFETKAEPFEKSVYKALDLDAKNYLYQSVEVALFKLLTAITVNHSKCPLVNGKPPRYGIIPKLFNEVAGIKLEGNNEERFKKLSKQLLDMAGNDFYTIFPSFLQKPIGEMIETSLLPETLEEKIEDITAWQRQEKEVTDRLNALFPKEKVVENLDKTSPQNNISHLGDEIKKYTARLIPDYMKNKSGEIVDLIMGTLPEQYLKDKDSLRELLTHALTVIAQDHHNAPVFENIADLVKAAFSKMSLGIATHFEKLEEDNQETSLLMRFSKLLMEESSGYIRTIMDLENSSLNIQQLGEEVFKKLKTDRKLHEALEGDTYQNGVLKKDQKVRLEKFYQPLAKKILRLAGMETCPKDFPVFGAYRETAWKLFEEKILPELLQSIFQEMLEPVNLKSKLLDMVKKLSTAVDSVDKPQDSKKEAIPKTDEDKAMDEQLGEIIKGIIKSAKTFPLPEFLTNFIGVEEAISFLINLNKISNLQAEQLGEALRNYLAEKKVLGLLDEQLKGFKLASPGALPVNEKHLNKELKNAMIEASFYPIKDGIKEAIMATIDKKLKEIEPKFIKEFKIDDVKNETVKAILNSLKTFLDLICKTLFESFLDFVLYVFLWIFASNKLSGISNKVIGAASLSTHENFAMTMVDAVLEALLEEPKRSNGKEEVDS